MGHRNFPAVHAVDRRYSRGTLIFQRFTSFNAHFVLPVVVKVVLVEETLIFAEFEFAQLNLAGITRKADAAVVVNTIILTMYVKPIQMLIAPAEGDLQCKMQASDCAVAAHKESAPDHRTDLANPHVEPVDLDIELFCHHWLILANGVQNCELITPAPGIDHSREIPRINPQNQRINQRIKPENQTVKRIKLAKIASVEYHCPMKTSAKDKKTSVSFIVGRTLPDKLPKATRDFFNTATTPQRALDIAAKAKSIAARSGSKSKNVC